MDGEIFESGKKKVRIQKYPDTCGRGLNEGRATAVILPGPGLTIKSKGFLIL